jgi:hypothetical protein
MNISELVGLNYPKSRNYFSARQPKRLSLMLNLLMVLSFVTKSLEIGAALSVVGEDGEIVPAPDGEHELGKRRQL